MKKHTPKPRNNVILPQKSRGINVDSKYIYLPDYFDSNEDGTAEDHPDDPDYYKTITHEFGHYGLYLYDEYLDANKKEYPRDTNGVPMGPPGFMNYPYTYSEMSTEIDYRNWNPPQGFSTTRQWDKNGESCWKTFFEKYKDIIWFDLNKDGTRDTTFLLTYTAESGPTLFVEGEYLIADIHNTGVI